MRMFGHCLQNATLRVPPGSHICKHIKTLLQKWCHTFTSVMWFSHSAVCLNCASLTFPQWQLHGVLLWMNCNLFYQPRRHVINCSPFSCSLGAQVGWSHLNITILKDSSATADSPLRVSFPPKLCLGSWICSLFWTHVVLDIFQRRQLIKMSPDQIAFACVSLGSVEEQAAPWQMETASGCTF